MKKNVIVLFISALAFIALIVSITLLLREHFQTPSCGCPKMISHNFVWLFIILAVIFVGGIVYFLLSLQLQRRDEAINFNLATILQFLDKDEKTILKQIKENQGKMLQSKIKNMTRLRKHRALRKLIDRNIVTAEKIGRENKIQLNKNFKIK